MTLARISNCRIVACLSVAFLLTAAVDVRAQVQASGTPTHQNDQTRSASSSEGDGADLPTSPAPDAPQQRPLPREHDNGLPKPLGTAAAPDPSEDGIPSSTTSGAAVAPIKQKRVRTFSIRTALLVGGIVAVGLVVGLTVAASAHP